MHRLLLLLPLLAFATAPLRAEVVRPAPDFAWEGAGGTTKSLKSLRGQPVVLLIADSARSGRLRSQIDRLEELYRFYSARGVVFAVALRSEARPLKSDIPFVEARSGADVAGRYGVERGFSIAIIGPDGNVDYITDQVLPGERVRDVVNNSYVRQQAIRKSN